MRSWRANHELRVKVKEFKDESEDFAVVHSASVDVRSPVLVLPQEGTESRKTMTRVFQNQRGPPHATDAQISELMHQTYLSIKPSLPSVYTPRVLDIGCGIGVYHVYIHRHYGGRSEHFLVDRALYQIGQKGYEKHSKHGGFNSVRKMPFYTSDTCAHEIAMSNGFTESNWHWVNATEENVRSIGQVDLAMSMLSWGYHYPVDTYADAVRSVLKPDGRLLITLRQSAQLKTQGLKSLERAGFRCGDAPEQTPIGNDAVLTLCRPSSHSA